MTIPTTCEENARMQTAILLSMARVLGITDAQIIAEGL